MSSLWRLSSYLTPTSYLSGDWPILIAQSDEVYLYSVDDQQNKYCSHIYVITPWLGDSSERLMRKRFAFDAEKREGKKYSGLVSGRSEGYAEI